MNVSRWTKEAEVSVAPLLEKPYVITLKTAERAASAHLHEVKYVLIKSLPIKSASPDILILTKSTSSRRPPCRWKALLLVSSYR